MPTAALLTVLTLVGAGWQLARSGTAASGIARAYGIEIGNYEALIEEGGQLAPPLSGDRLGGGDLTLQDFDDRVVVLNLWASWCGPCRAEQPALERVWREYKDRGVQFLGLNFRDQEAAARAFREEFGVTYPSFFDPPGSLTTGLGARVLPTTFVVDRGGRIVVRLLGTVSAGVLRDVLDDVLDSGSDDG